MMQTADAIAHFFSNTPKRQLALKELVENFLQGERRKKWKMCRTRWVERHEAFEVFSNLSMPTESAAWRPLQTVPMRSGTGIRDPMPCLNCWPCHSSHSLWH